MFASGATTGANRRLLWHVALDQRKKRTKVRDAILTDSKTMACALW